MDFRSRGGQAPISPTGSTTTSTAASRKFNSIWLERGWVVLLFSVAIIILAIAALTFFSGNAESKDIRKGSYQAVFLNNGQVYFGNIQSLNAKFIDLQNIYYLQTNNQSGADTTASSNQNVSLVKLGCELHAPYDQMIINRDQVIFWENLKDSGQVVKAIAQYKKDNPSGQTCNSSSSNSTQQAPSTSTQSTTTPTPSGSSSTTTKKP